MDTEFKKEFEDLAVVINAGFEGMEKRMDEKFDEVNQRMDDKFAEIRNEMATKDDVARLTERVDGMETRMATTEGLRVVESRLSTKINEVKEAVEKLDARDKADTDALAGDVLSLRQRVGALETKA